MQAQDENQRIPLDYVDATQANLQANLLPAVTHESRPPTPQPSTSTHQLFTSTVDVNEDESDNESPQGTSRKRKRTGEEEADEDEDEDDGLPRKWHRPAPPPTPERPPSPHRERRSLQRRNKRQARRVGAIHATTLSDHRARLAKTASTVEADFDSGIILNFTSGYLGRERVKKEVKAERRVYELEELVGENSIWKFQRARGPTLIADTNGRAFVARIPAPAGDPTFKEAAEEAADVMDQYRPCFFNASKPFPEHRRGDFPVKAMGVSYGGGQEEAKELHQSDKDLELLDRIREMPCFQRLAGHASAAFRTWAPRLYLFYSEYMKNLLDLMPHLSFNFENSIFACCTLNFGPTTTTIEHVDHMNYCYGWCAITALGDFNFQLGGHLVLWDLKLVVELPPGWTMMIPSAFLRHSNTSLQPGETRFSLTQYTAAGLFRIVDDNGVARNKMTARDLAYAEQRQLEQITEALNRYSTLDELLAQA
ncbi:hypothetical protein F5878DRAFT_548610 [Lentinula raphanica]|uniref:Uncharacterized protein n=1 Tax=Lentinula raphanica TaxID=153919 RepID=A0AA38NWV9_9AGAR|nr:hypothetical protein F5878DRAFT_548610 [Lentinula raphanica]